MKLNKYLLMTMIGLIMLIAPTIASLQSVEYISIQATSPVVSGELCSIDVQIKSTVGATGVATLFIDGAFYTSIGGIAGSDAIMYFSTGWTATTVGTHVLRVVYFEDGYPTQPFETSTTIVVTDEDGFIPPPPPTESPISWALPIQIAGFGIASFGGFNYFIKKKRN